jgi:Zn-finger domain-containing protein
MRKLLVVGATSKRGQVARQINWIRIREGMKELDGMSERTLRHRYQEALRIIVSELTIARIA